MNKQSKIQNPKPKIAIAGAGPAGASLAVRLAGAGFETVLIEREQFPREKLCGEFISPECFRHFEDLRVLDSMLEAGGDRIHETRFYESRGRSISVPTNWFGQGDFALSLSRAEMDQRLLNRAKQVGVTVTEGTSITDVQSENGRVLSIGTRTNSGDGSRVSADIFVDATGRSRILTKLAEKNQGIVHDSVKPKLVGFKTHLRDADLPDGLCEIYSFPGGYAGVSHVENGLFNLCFLLKATTVRAVGSDAGELMRRVVRKNKRADVTLQDAAPVNDWLAVAIDGFGAKQTAIAGNVFTVGDAAAFIDPFTGSGMVMALESANILAETIAAHRSTDRIAAEYLAAYKQKFANRLRVCSLLRRTAFMPNVATAIVSLLAVSTNARRGLARATRGASSDPA